MTLLIIQIRPRMNRFLAIVACLHCVTALYSIGYYSRENGAVLVNGNAKYAQIPDAHQVADLYARLSGNAPLSNEGTLNLPNLDSLNVQPHDVKILEVFGGNLPKEVSPVAKSSSKFGQPPKLASVLDALRTNKISADGTTIHAKDASVDEWLKKQTTPVFVVHHSTPTATAAAPSRTSRALADDASSSGTNDDPAASAPLSEFQISQYQICLWTAVIFFLLLLASVCSIAKMEVIPDSLLYAKFQSGRTGKNE